MSIPSFLTSGASSRAHHALIVALNDSKSDREEGEVLAEEVGRIKMALGKGVSSAKVAEKLIILLHCDMVSTEIQPRKSESDGSGARGDNMDWALLAALKVAEGGKTLGERRIGYLYLCERLPPNHELALLWINTIRKDLSSTNPHDTLLALNAIISHPSPDLLPAVSPLLIAKGLLRHRSAMVRQKVVIALRGLYLSRRSGAVDLSRTIGREGLGDSSRDGGRTGFPLGMSKVVRLVDKEKDVGVASALVRLLKGLIEEGHHTVQDDTERTFLLETVIAQAKRAEAGLTIVRDVLEAVRVLMRPEAESSEIVEAWIAALLKVKGRANPAILLDICLLVAVLIPASQDRLKTPLIRNLEALLHPAPPRASASSSASSSPSRSRSAASTTPPTANNHVPALRCLSVLPSRLWDTALGEDGMRIIMEGLHSPDDTIRLGTLRLLNALSPDLLSATLQNYIQNIISASDLALPLGLGEGVSLEEKVRVGVEETGMRALEVVRVRFEACTKRERRAGEGSGAGEAGKAGQEEAAGKSLAEGVRDVLCAVGEARGGAAGGGGDGGGGKGSGSGVWEGGLRVVLDLVGSATPTTRQAFVHALLDGVTSGDSTLAVILATTAAEHGVNDERSGMSAISVLLSGVDKHSSSVQELMLVAATGIASRLPDNAHGAVKQGFEVALVEVRKNASGYMRKRCDQIGQIIHDPTLLRRLAAETKSQSITDYLQSIIDIARSVEQFNSASLGQSREEEQMTAGSRSLGRSALRYDAYDAPGRSASSVSRSTSRSTTGQTTSARSSRSVSNDRERVSRSDGRSYGSRSSALNARRIDAGVLAGTRLGLGVGMSPAAGEYTLFSADEDESNDRSALLDDEERVDNLVGLSLGMRTGSDGRHGFLGRGNSQGGVSDPFGADEDEEEGNEGDGPLTPRLR